MDVRYFVHNPRLDFSEDTSIGQMTREEYASWKERVVSSLGASTSSEGPCAQPVCIGVVIFN